MTESRLNKALYTDITLLKLCSKKDAPVRFLLDKSPFDDDEDDGRSTKTASADEYLIIGRILPNSDIYKEAAYKIEMKLTRNFPVDPPEVRFLTPVYHPNVSKDGKFCHELLKKTAKWDAKKSLVDVVKAVVDRIDKPDIEYSVTYDIGEEYTDKPADFQRHATEYVRKHGLPRQ